MDSRNPKPVRVLIVGCGQMGTSHGLAYHKIDGFEVVGVVNRSAEKRQALAKQLGGVPEFDDFEQALSKTKPDAVSINTHPDSHYTLSMQSLEAGAHLFVEKPLAETVQKAEEILSTAPTLEKQVVVGYILRHHPSWTEFVEQARTLGSPLVMRMNLNQQSAGEAWKIHQKLMSCVSPLVDCGVHYVDIMCQMTQSKPLRVSAMGTRLTDSIDPDMYNYGQLQVTFEDGSVGWYEAGWGPMMSENAYFIKDAIGPMGSVSMVPNITKNGGGSSDINFHTAAEVLHLHRATLNGDAQFEKEDEEIALTNEPDHQELCSREQQYFLKAIQENLDLSEHHRDTIHSLKIVLAADESIKTGKIVEVT